MADTGTSTRHGGARHDVSKRPEHLTGMATAHHVSSTQARCRPAKPSATGQRTAPPPHAPAHRHATPCSNLIAAFPWAASASTSPPRLALGAKTRPRSLPRKGRETSREAQGAPRETPALPRFAFTPCTAAFPQAPSAPQGAPRGRAPTRGGRQPWERASTRGRTRQCART